MKALQGTPMPGTSVRKGTTHGVVKNATKLFGKPAVAVGVERPWSHQDFTTGKVSYGTQMTTEVWRLGTFEIDGGAR